MDDYLRKYLDEESNTFDIMMLINDDFFEAIRLTFNSRKYVSSSKLLMSFIDSIGYVAYGDNGNVFIRWINENMKLDAIEATPEELWEFRNSLLHMSNLDSRKVVKGDVRRLMTYVGPRAHKINGKDIVFVNYLNLIDQVAFGVRNMVGMMEAGTISIADFCSRYDLIASDARYEYVKY